VPTCRFEDENTERHLIWIAICNSFTIDWILRRWVSTTLNFFFLKNLPFPRLDLKSTIAKDIYITSERLSTLKILDENTTLFDSDQYILDLWERAFYRAKIDAIVAHLFNLSFKELCYILDDFPLVDSAMPPLPDELQSTVTKDLVKHEFIRLSTNDSELFEVFTELEGRISEARYLGSVPYCPSSNWRVISNEIDELMH
jgi:hypothetical protein